MAGNQAAVAKNSERKSNDANGSSEGGEDILSGCRKERAGEAAEAEMGQDLWRILYKILFYI